MLRKQFIIKTVFDQLKTYPKLGIISTVVVSDFCATCWRGSSRIHFNQKSRSSRWLDLISKCLCRSEVNLFARV
ncbi:hypothetical protein [Candidatus Enterovibrio escicola]|uniref:hypothetical protein n=1 Tax=Candidatus Enterovibrio escicola TaxID=1927127 RepID=UPI0012381C6F|nr:hypothetical protein [Candidatus Enterovibrio escacola]